MLVFITFILIILFGYLILNLFKETFPLPLERLALGAILGMGLITLGMFIMGLLAIPFTRGNILAALTAGTVLVGLLVLARGKLGRIKKNTDLFKETDRWKWCLIFLIGFLIFWSFLQTTYWPPFAWDALSLYDFRAKVFADTHTLSGEIFTLQPSLASYTYSYPFFTSLAHALVYIMGGENPQFIYSLMYTAFLVFVYFAFKKITSKKISLLAVLIIGVSRSFLYHSTIAYTNLPYSIYFVISTIFLWQFWETGRKGYLYFGTIFLGLSTWVRSVEPFWAVNLGLLFLYLVPRKKITLLISNLIIFFAIRQLWIKYYLGMLKNVDDPAMVQTHFRIDFSNLFKATWFFVDQVIWVKEWFLVFLIFGLALFLGRNSLKRYWYVPLTIFLYLIVFWGGIYYYSLNYSWWDKIGGSINRLSFFLIPLLLYSSIKLAFNIKNLKKAAK